MNEGLFILGAVLFGLGCGIGSLWLQELDRRYRQKCAIEDLARAMEAYTRSIVLPMVGFARAAVKAYSEAVETLNRVAAIVGEGIRQDD